MTCSLLAQQFPPHTCSLLRALEKGPEAKSVLDAVIDAASAMQNLRDGINAYRSRFLKEARERQRNTLLSVCLVSMGGGMEGGCAQHKAAAHQKSRFVC